ncbi:MAG TPA: ABC transporter permease [Candidatus Binataceae bacterium]|nr:ABC transporter permease [Candidatus Binataceae bacterium]
MEVLPHQTAPSARAPVAATPEAKAPRFIIEAGRGSLWVGLGELWTHRELLYFLTWRDVKLRYKQTALGVLWAVLQPLLMMVAFTLLFGRLAHVPSDGLPYSLFAFAGLVPWQFFQNAVTQSGASVIGNAQLVTKVYFPRMAIPGAAVGAALVDFAIASVILFAMMACYGMAPGAGILMFPALVALLAIFAGAVGMWMAGMNVKYRDIKYVMPFMLQFWMIATPVIYPSNFVPGGWRWILTLNPLTGIIGGFRSALLERPFDWPAIAVAAALTLGAAAYSVWSFQRMERSFADVI